MKILHYIYIVLFYLFSKGRLQHNASGKGKDVKAGTSDWTGPKDMTCEQLCVRLGELFPEYLLPENRNYNDTRMLNKMLSGGVGSKNMNTTLIRKDENGNSTRGRRYGKLVVKFTPEECTEFINKHIKCGNKDFIESVQEKQQFEIDIDETPYVLCKPGTNKELAPTWNVRDFDEACYNDRDHFVREIGRYVMMFDKQGSSVLVDALAELAGKTPNGDDAFAIRLFNPATEYCPNPQKNNGANQELDYMLEDAGLSGTSHCLVGGRNFDRWDKQTNPDKITFSGSNPNTDFMYDPLINKKYGEDCAFMIMDGAVQVTNFEELVGVNEDSIGHVRHYVIYSPAGIAINATWEHIMDGSGCNKYRLRMWAYLGVYGLPTYGCKDETKNVNGIIKIQDCSNKAYVGCGDDFTPKEKIEVCRYSCFPYAIGTPIRNDCPL